jgi:hypothetical protein
VAIKQLRPAAQSGDQEPEVKPELGLEQEGGVWLDVRQLAERAAIRLDRRSEQRRSQADNQQSRRKRGLKARLEEPCWPGD